MVYSRFSVFSIYPRMCRRTCIYDWHRAVSSWRTMTARKSTIYIYIYIESCNKTQYPITGNWQLEPIRRCIVIVASPSDIFRIYMYKAVNCASTRPAKWYTARLLTHSFTPAYRSQTLSLIIFSFSSLYAACCRSTVHHCVVLCK